jgi:branched-chain amino acid transport system permease protein
LALALSPLVVGIFGMIIERVMLKRLYHLDHLYGLLLTFGLALIIEGMFRHWYGISGESYDIPQVLTGGMNLGFMFLPFYRAWVIVASLVICFATWYVIERTKLGAYLRAGTENSKLLQAFGVNVPLLITLTYGYGVALAALAGVMAAPIFQVNPVMGSNLIIVVFAVVVIGGMGSIFGSIVTGLGLGVIEGLTKVFYPEASGVVIFVIMAIVLLLRPAGLFGRENVAPSRPFRPREIGGRVSKANKTYIVLLIIGLLAPLQDAIYLVFIMKVLCFALFACAFNLLLGFVGLLSFGHAAFLGTAAYVAGYAAKVWGLTPELAIIAATLVSAALGYVFGSLAIRRQGIYFAMITLALSQMIFFLSVQFKFTGGEDGIQGIPRGKLFGLIDLSNDTSMYYFVLAVFVFGFALIYRTIHSPFGEVLKSIRENEPRAISLGYDVDRFKLLAFVLSAGLAGLAGATKALVFQLASLTDVHWHMSGEVVLMSLLGGMSTIFGPFVGALTVVGLQYYLAGIGSWSTIATGAIFVVCVLAFRRGIVGELAALFDRKKDDVPG